LMSSDVSMRNLRREGIWPIWMKLDALWSNWIKWNEMKWNEMKWNEMEGTGMEMEWKWNETKFVHAILNLIQFHLTRFDLIWFDLIEKQCRRMELSESLWID
jgi:hypothetical protein